MSWFTRETFAFLRELKENNDRDWFNANRPRYEEFVLGPSVRFIMDFSRRLQRISPHFRADPRPVGGSLFRIYRDTRFSKDKSPFKTYIGIQFRHERGRDVHAPGFYLHIEPGSVFAGMGLWHPDAAALRAIRQFIVASPERWTKAVGGAAFGKRLELAGETLSRPPRGFDPEHPLITDLQRKDYIAVARFTQRTATSDDLVHKFAEACRAGKPMVGFLCEALRLEF